MLRAVMWPVGPGVRGSTLAVTLATLAAAAGCAGKLASPPRPSLRGCGGLFTTVALPRVTAGEQQALEQAVPRLTASALHLHLRRSY